MLTERLLQVTLVGSEWVLYLLLVLSVASIALMIERTLFFRANRIAWNRLLERVEPLLHSGQVATIEEIVRTWHGNEAEVLRAVFEGAPRGRDAAEKLVHAALLNEQQRLESRLAFLGTMGNNAPFIGLFGTVLGIIRAFRDLSLDVKGGANVVMAGISEALIATAVGLFVAIPAVIAFNYYMRRSARSLVRAQSTVDRLMALMPAKSEEPS